jgi:hypothetical protein
MDLSSTPVPEAVYGARAGINRQQTTRASLQIYLYLVATKNNIPLGV